MLLRKKQIYNELKYMKQCIVRKSRKFKYEKDTVAFFAKITQNELKGLEE